MRGLTQDAFLHQVKSNGEAEQNDGSTANKNEFKCSSLKTQWKALL